jgi:CheY-like chemotaxis protein
MTVNDRDDETTAITTSWEEQPYVKLNLSAVASEALAIVRSRLEAKGRNIASYSQTCTLDEVPPIIGNPPELREAIAGLIVNAVEAMPEGGSLALTCRTSANQVRVEVEDSGCGLSERQRRTVLQCQDADTGPSVMGMRLPDIYEIVKRHGGDIEVVSTPGEGSIFALSFHVFAPQNIDAAMPTAIVEKAAPGRILVIDDEVPIAELLMEALQLDGHHVEIAGSGLEGVEMASQTPFDLVLTDLDMPGISGWEVAKRIRTISPDSQVLLVTGWSEAITDEQMSQAGVTALVHKPFEIKELLSMTAKTISGRNNE